MYVQGNVNSSASCRADLFRQAGIMDTSSVDTEKNAYFAALVNCYCDHHAKTKQWKEAEAIGFLNFLFTSRSLLAASIVNR